MTGRKGESALDSWSWVHVASGVALAFLLESWLWVALILVVYEVLEAGLRHIRLKDGGLFEYESWWNIVVDLVVGMAGFLAARWALHLLDVAPFL